MSDRGITNSTSKLPILVSILFESYHVDSGWVIGTFDSLLDGDVRKNVVNISKYRFVLSC